MKKLFIILTACFAGLGMMKAANTDISALDNIIYVDPFSAEANSQVYLSFKMKNSKTIRGFQFKISLPDGVTVVDDSQVFTENRKAVGVDDHTLAWSNQTDGTLLFLCGTSTLKAFQGNDGEVVRVIINIPDLAIGDYPVILTEMKLNGPDGSYTTTDPIETTLTITGSFNGTVKLNENFTTLPVPMNGAKVEVTRTISADNWNTICLPFALGEDQITDIFGDDVELATLRGMKLTDADYTIRFKSADIEDGMDANTPYLIKVSAPISKFSISSIKVEPDESKTTFSKSGVSFIGTLKAGTILEENQLFLNGNMFYYSTGTTTIKGFRGYFVLDGFDPSASSAPTFEIDGETTSIDEINIVDGDGRIYNLNGQHIENPTKKGVYIQNGKKVVMKK